MPRTDLACRLALEFPGGSGDLAGLVLLREVLKLGLYTQRTLLALYTDGMPSAKKIQKAVLTVVMGVAVKVSRCSHSDTIDTWRRAQ